MQDARGKIGKLNRTWRWTCANEFENHFSALNALMNATPWRLIILCYLYGAAHAM